MFISSLSSHYVARRRPTRPPSSLAGTFKIQYLKSVGARRPKVTAIHIQHDVLAWFPRLPSYDNKKWSDAPLFPLSPRCPRMARPAPLPPLLSDGSTTTRPTTLATPGAIAANSSAWISSTSVDSVDGGFDRQVASVLPRRFMQLQFSFIPALTHPSDSGGASLPHRESPPRAHMPLPSALSHRATLTLIPHRPVSSALCPFAPRRAWLSHGAPRRPRPAHPAPPAAAAPARGRRVPPCSNRRVLST
ncbi:hypothetical protein C8J57DRAFT_1728076, partial [Mycena rebaudengoi]